jgi:hypothetical protein
MSTDSTDSVVAPPEGGAPAEDPPSVGSAERLADGTLNLFLRTQTDDGTVGEAMMIVPPDDPRHAGILAHLGGLAPGQGCEIPPFPPPQDEEDD